ncbi:MAG: hypothetical protein IPJ43_21035, partial [Saprospiraceae bacterium]|nr:hypothetical protein [Saprospiraceae bacterium]
EYHRQKLGRRIKKATKELSRIAELRADVWQKAVEIGLNRKFDIDIVKSGWSPSITAIKEQRLNEN